MPNNSRFDPRVLEPNNVNDKWRDENQKASARAKNVQHGPGPESSLTVAIKKAVTADDAFQHLQDATMRGVKINVAHVNAALHQCSRKEAKDVADLIWDFAQKSKVAPDIVTFSTMAAVCNRTGFYSEAVDWALLRHLGPDVGDVSINHVAYTEAIRAKSRLREPDVALQLLREAKKKEDSASQILTTRVWANAKMYTAVIKAFAMCGRMVEAQALLQEMIAEADRLPTHLQPAVQPNDVTYTVLMQGWADLGELQKARSSLADMVGAGFECDAHCQKICGKYGI